jgi:hypothetical protein
MADKRFRSDRECDPIAELARLIAQSDTHGESAPAGNRFREEPVSDGYNEPPELPPAPQLPVDLKEHGQAFERDEHRPDDQAYEIDYLPYAAGEGYQNDVPRVRRRSLTLADGNMRPCADWHGLRVRLPRHVRRRGAADC